MPHPIVVVADYLAQCGVEPSFDGDRTGAYGFVRTDICPGGVCLIYETETCVMQGCTIRCDSDDDCPMGSICWLDFYDWSSLGPCTECAICKPGRPGLIGVDLACP